MMKGREKKNRHLGDFLTALICMQGTVLLLLYELFYKKKQGNIGNLEMGQVHWRATSNCFLHCL